MGLFNFRMSVDKEECNDYCGVIKVFRGIKPGSVLEAIAIESSGITPLATMSAYAKDGEITGASTPKETSTGPFWALFVDNSGDLAMCTKILTNGGVVYNDSTLTVGISITVK